MLYAFYHNKIKITMNDFILLNLKLKQKSSKKINSSKQTQEAINTNKIVLRN